MSNGDEFFELVVLHDLNESQVAQMVGIPVAFARKWFVDPAHKDYQEPSLGVLSVIKAELGIFVNNDTTLRNALMAVRVLRGDYISDVATSHGITRERGRQIVSRVCEKVQPDLFSELQIEASEKGKRLTHLLRRNQRAFLPLLEKLVNECL